MAGGSDPPANTTSTTTQTVELPGWIKPYSKALLKRGVAASKIPYAAYTGNRVAGLTPDQLTAMQGIRSTAGGQFLNPETNPYLRATYDASAGALTDAYRRGTAAQTDAAAARANAFGGSAYNERVSANERDLGRTLGDLSTQLYGGNYQTERDRQQQATGQLYTMGEQERQLGQQGLENAYQEWLMRREWPLRQLDILGSAIGQSLGRSGTTTTSASTPQPQFNNYAGLLGAGLAGYGLYRGI